VSAGISNVNPAKEAEKKRPRPPGMHNDEEDEGEERPEKEDEGPQYVFAEDAAELEAQLADLSGAEKKQKVCANDCCRSILGSLSTAGWFCPSGIIA
jgi:hypothetical protein